MTGSECPPAHCLKYPEVLSKANTAKAPVSFAGSQRVVLKSYFYDRMRGLQVIPRIHHVRTIWANIWDRPLETDFSGVMHPSSPLASSRHRFRPAPSPCKQARSFFRCSGMCAVEMLKAVTIGCRPGQIVHARPQPNQSKRTAPSSILTPAFSLMRWDVCSSGIGKAQGLAISWSTKRDTERPPSRKS